MDRNRRALLAAMRVRWGGAQRPHERKWPAGADNRASGPSWIRRTVTREARMFMRESWIQASTFTGPAWA